MRSQSDRRLGAQLVSLTVAAVLSLNGCATVHCDTEAKRAAPTDKKAQDAVRKKCEQRLANMRRELDAKEISPERVVEAARAMATASRVRPVSW